ncbi:hypothetical protein BCR39DRAFT_520273 [Naematelia encephala]|uniref:1-phosphatidylinositol 4-kinase n=1 Tax=Naematelia encephala TaxID=71784 RepID=A0A1Y2BF90_9TREE|nr:hypothetical protein BCR39DRAFT_520273 [Naematelia encephala]
MDCLDEPLHLQILTSLASSLAKTPLEKASGAPDAGGEDHHVNVLLEGLPITPVGGQLGCGNQNGDEHDEWDDFEINHAISFAHYVSSLPVGSLYLETSLPRIKLLLNGLLHQGRPHRSDSTPSSSGGSRFDRVGAGTAPQAQLCEGLLRSLIWISWTGDQTAAEVGGILVDLLHNVRVMMKEDTSLTFPLVLLQSIHSALSHCPLPDINPELLATLLNEIIAISAPGILVKLLQDSNSYGSSPGLPHRHNPFIAPHPVTPGAVVMLAAEIASILLATPLLPRREPEQERFASPAPTTHHQPTLPLVQTIQTNQLVEEQLVVGKEKLLYSISAGQAVLQDAGSAVLRWWSELTAHDGASSDEHETARRNSLFSLGGAIPDEEIELSVAVLHLMNLLSLHHPEPEPAHLARLRLFLSEDSTASDARVLEAAFICTCILARNNPDLGTSLTLHIRRLLMSPLPAFEGEMASHGGDVPPAVVAAAKCLAICIKVSGNDDLVPSTLYSLLNTLSHGGSTIVPGAAASVRTHPALIRDGERMTTSSISGGKKTDDQRRLVAVTAVEVVSRLALEINQDDIIHLSISLLLQRLRGIDLATEATIVTNLVPLALAGSNVDLVEVYRAFSQISRSSHPEDPRISSNALLAAQTKLARGLGRRLDCADGYLQELLVLFADKGTQTQMIAMAPAGYDSRDKENLAQLRADSEARVKEMKAGLAALLIPISTLMSHPSYHPDNAASPELVAHFRNMWFLCVTFGLSGPAGRTRLSEHQSEALSIIAEKTPALVLESATDYVESDLEYNSILRKDYAASVLSRQRAILSDYLPHQKHVYEIRIMSAPQTTLLMAIHDLEEARTLRQRPSVMLQYFCNESINQSSLIGCLDAIASKLLDVLLHRLSSQAVTHRMPHTISDEVCKILVCCTHRYRKVREIALRNAQRLIQTFPSLMCDRGVVFTLLEILTLLRRSCELQYTDEYSPVYDFHSDKLDLTLTLTEDFGVRNEITTQLHSVARGWLNLAISRSPIEVQSTLQSYLNESRDVLLIDSVEMGAGLALHFSKAIPRVDRQETLMPNIGGWPSDCSNLVASQFAAKNYHLGELSGARHVLNQGLSNLQSGFPGRSSKAEIQAFKSQMAEAVMNIRKREKSWSIPEIRRILLRAVSVLVHSPTMDSDIVHYLVELPMAAFTPLSIAAGADAWTWLLRARPGAEVAIIGEISAGWLATIGAGKGIFSTSMNYQDPFETPVEYSPSDKKILDLELAKARRLLRPHLLLINVLSSQFQAVKYREPGIMTSLIRLMMRSLVASKKMSTHPLAREVRFSLLLFGFQILASSRMEALLELRFRDRLYATAFAWFSVRPQWSFGSDRIQVGAEIKLLQEFLTAIQEDTVRGNYSVSSMSDRAPAFLVPGSTSLQDYTTLHRDRIRILQLLVESEISRLLVWYNPLNEPNRGSANPPALEKTIAHEEWSRLVLKAWKISPAMAVHMGERFKYGPVLSEIARLVRTDPKAVIDVPEALHYLLGDKLDSASRGALKWLPVWAAVPPVSALVYFQPRYGNHPLILQYGMRVLEQHPVELTFFFVPQVVQALRTDGLGYVERFIFETSKISQLFCHQIIWNMKANTYRDDDASQPDPMKPMLDRMIDMIVAGLSGKAKAFYDLEFEFFDEVTSISGKLRPFIKKSKPEKKEKIDEEMAKIKLSVGVYLPSNPDGVVIDLDRKSGRPLQSHAKAPFMATFKVQKEKIDLPTNASIEIADEARMVKTKYDVWQSAIFKVGDDCRQDVLALQIIAMFKNVFNQIGLTLYLFPYRVTATAPGCGVIDVVPNATSRDEMGRAKVNDLLSYFIDKYGGVDTVPFQKARMNFIQSMAAYSVACYILQIKDRHNGNIMIDGDGHIVHIDFGFLFDIGPGGIKFEPSSFKLNHEMVALMGGRDSQGYKMFAELTVKAFLAIRPHADQLCDACHLMLGTGLPSFKGEGTIRRLKDRFALHLNERAGAEYMMGVVRNAHENMRSNVYDGFQKMQNGIPY